MKRIAYSLITILSLVCAIGYSQNVLPPTGDTSTLRDAKSALCKAVQPSPGDKVSTCEVTDVDYRDATGIHKALLAEVVVVIRDMRNASPQSESRPSTATAPVPPPANPPMCERGNPALPRAYASTTVPYICTMWGRNGGINDVLSPPKVVLAKTYFLQLPNKNVVALGQDFWWPDKRQTNVFTQLGFLDKTVDDGAFDLLIEHIDGQYCFVDKMKAPFTGELVRCKGGKIQGSVGYLPNAMNPQEAQRLVCQNIEAGNLTKCDGNIYTSSLHRDGEGQLFYVIGVRVYDQCPSPIEITRDLPLESRKKMNGNYYFLVSFISKSAALASIHVHPTHKPSCD